MIMITNAILCIVSILLFLYVLRVQVKLKLVYRNGLNGIRISNIITTIILILVCLARLIFFTTENIFDKKLYMFDFKQVFLYYHNSVMFLFLSIINFLYHKGYNFNIFNHAK